MAESRKQTKKASQPVQNHEVTCYFDGDPDLLDSQDLEPYVYKPSDKVLAKLAELPKDEIKRQIGVDIDYLIKTTKQYGILESLAYGQHTQRPISVRLPGVGKCYGTVKVYVNKGELKCQIHPTNLVPKKDNNGKLIQKKNKYGAPMYDSRNNPVYEMEYDRNPIKVGESNFSIDRMGNVTYSSNDVYRTLDNEQMNQLRLLGRLCGTITLPYSTDKNTNETVFKEYIINTNKYNNHKLLKYPVEQLRNRLLTKPLSRTFRQWVDNVPIDHELTEKQIDDLIKDGGVKLENPGHPAVYVYYDILKDKLYKGMDLQHAVNQEYRQKATQAEARALEKELKQNQTVGKGQKL